MLVPAARPERRALGVTSIMTRLRRACRKDSWSRSTKMAERGWLWLHESGTNVKFTQPGAELFA
jgi:hypothetical protein